MNKIQKVLIIGFVWPEPNSSAAGGRMLQLIEVFQQQGMEVVFSSPAMESDYLFDLDSIGVQKQKILLNDDSFDVYVKNLNPDIVLFDRFMMEEQFGWRVAENCPDALRILDTEDLHCLRQARQLAFKENRDFQTSDLFLDIAKREVASILRCDLSLMISEVEMDLLQKVFKVDPALLYYLPFLLNPLTDEEIEAWPKFEQRKNFVFIGNFLHEPNWNAVQYLKETVWPLIKKQLPEADLHIYGAYPSQKVLQLHNPKQGFYIMGRAANAQQVVKAARIVLAPLRFGAGIKGKLVEAMQCGTPTITTNIGAESMHGDLPWNGFVSDSPQELANEAVKLYNDEQLWRQAQQYGIEILKRRYMKEELAPNFVKKIKYLLSDFRDHRLNNFMGAMLQHHTLTSTKYLSRWITEKNKKA